MYPALLYALYRGNIVLVAMLSILLYGTRVYRERLRGCMRVARPSVVVHELSPGPTNAQTFSIQLMHPHGLWTEAGALCALLTRYEEMTKMVVLIDRTLYYGSPVGVLCVEMLTGIAFSYLTHQNVQTVLRDGKSILVYPGGFLELADFDDTRETLYTHMYGYWLRMAKEYGADLASSGREIRRWCARRRIPCILPKGIRHVPHDATVDTVSDMVRRVAGVVAADADSGHRVPYMPCE